MATTVPEPLNVEAWPVEIQQTIYDELHTLLGKPVPLDYSTMTDAELEAAMAAIFVEASSRTSAVKTVLDQTQLGDMAIQKERD